jgi:hypothetical protein
MLTLVFLQYVRVGAPAGAALKNDTAPQHSISVPVGTNKRNKFLGSKLFCFALPVVSSDTWLARNF